MVQPDLFSDFFDRYPKYQKEIEKNPQRDYVIIDFDDLQSWDKDIATKILEEPDEYIENLSKATIPFTNLNRKIVKIINNPNVAKIRKINVTQNAKLIQVRGIVVQVNPTLFTAKDVAWRCEKTACGQITHTEQKEPLEKLIAPKKCTACKKRSTFIQDKNLTIYTEYKLLIIQERYEDMPAGDIPEMREVILLGNYVDDCPRVGDYVIISGIVRIKPPQKAIFDYYLEANYIGIENKESGAMEILLEEEIEIRKYAEDPNIYNILINSIAPELTQIDHIKEAVAYLLFGGVRKIKEQTETRGDIHVLLVGDPSTAKSQLMLALTKIAPRCEYIVGTGASGVGLTASAIKTEGGWILKAGALVLADKGIACIDELEKISNDEVQNIHSALEQGIVTLHKAGKNVRLSAQCAVLAAANPASGRYQKNSPLSENINLSPSLLSRFDLIFILKDEPERKKDIEIARHILEHENHKTISLIPTNLLKKYIAYARTFKPKLTKEAIDFLIDFYVKTRSKFEEKENSPIQLTTRQLEALNRIAEASARIKLKDKADIEDAYRAVNIMTKFLSDVGINPETGEIDIDLIMTGKPKTLRERMGAIIKLLDDNEIHEANEIINELKKMDIEIDEARKLLIRLSNEGTIFQPEEGKYKKAMRG